VVDDSPAQLAGLKAGDRLISLDGHVVKDLRGYSNLLKELEPGDTVMLMIQREEMTVEIKVTLRAR
jgi:S1-C subfamily serine protease